MGPPFVLSPYLRPVLEGAEVVLDNGLTARRERLAPAELAVVRALWTSEPDDEALLQVVEAVGEAAAIEALGALARAAVVFPDRASCELLFDQLLEAGRPPVPFVDQVELTNRCPMRCGFCPRGRPGGMSRPEGLMDLGLFLRLLGELHPRQAGYRPLELHHLGESLLHPEVHRFVEAAAARGLPTEMSVNPSLLTAELARRLLDAGIRRLVVSLDGTDEETLAAARGPAARYSRAERNLEALLELVAARDDPPRVVVQMLDLARNRDQHEGFLARWGRTGLPSVVAYVKDLDGPDPETGRASSRPLRHLCTYPFRSVVVLWDGRVVPCCRDADAALALGDLRRDSLEAIFAGEPAADLRRAYRLGPDDPGHLCAGCDWSRRRFAEAMAERHPDRARPDPLAW